MKKIIILCCLLISVISKSQTPTELSVSFLGKMIREQFDSCETYFDPSITDKINASKMQQAWNSIPTYVGEYKSFDNIRTEKKDSVEFVILQCAFEKTKLDLKFAYNKKLKIIGLLFVPPTSKNAYNLPEYYEASKLYETKLTVKTGTFEMPGMLCVPNNIQNPPVVILLAGSGPNDKDGTIAGNKVLKDIALGLASKGIASLRYDKRAFAQGGKIDINKFGLYEEVVEDALSAIKILRENAITKESKIVVAGHSLGGMCAPWIASKSKDISGVILLAGPARRLEDAVMDQYIYLGSVDSASAESNKAIADMKIKVATVKNSKALKSAAAKDLPLGVSAFYWESINKYDHVATAKKVKQPMLILNGERDYQVTMVDFNWWKKELGSNLKNKFISYPKLNHLFMKGEGKPNPEEYEKPNNVDAKVILDMVEFIKSIK